MQHNNIVLDNSRLLGFRLLAEAGASTGPETKVGRKPLLQGSASINPHEADQYARISSKVGGKRR